MLRWGLGWFPFWAYSFFVYQSAILPPEKIPIFFTEINDKAVHGIEYFILFLFTVHAFLGAKSSRLHSRPLLYALGWCLLMGMATEISQAFVPGRTASFLDWAADVAGGLLAMFLYRLWKR